MNRPGRLSKLALVATSAALAVLSVASPAGARPPVEAVGAGDDYVALGSSFASGSGLDPYSDPGCLRSAGQNYPQLVAAGLGLDLTDVSCGGAAVDNVTRVSQVASDGVARPAQVGAVTPETDVVTITVGGNDVNYLLDLYTNSCATPASDPVLGPIAPFVCPRPVNPAFAQTQLDGLTAELVAMVRAVRARAPQARIVLVDYLTILPQNGHPCAALPLTREEIRYSLDVARQLQLATKHAAQRSGAELVELSKASRGHDVCSPEPWVAGWVAGVPSGGWYHPNDAGMRAAAALVTDQLT